MLFWCLPGAFLVPANAPVWPFAGASAQASQASLPRRTSKLKGKDIGVRDGVESCGMWGGGVLWGAVGCGL